MWLERYWSHWFPQASLGAIPTGSPRFRKVPWFSTNSISYFLWSPILHVPSHFGFKDSFIFRSQLSFTFIVLKIDLHFRFRKSFILMSMVDLHIDVSSSFFPDVQPSFAFNFKTVPINCIFKGSFTYRVSIVFSVPTVEFLW